VPSRTCSAVGLGSALCVVAKIKIHRPPCSPSWANNVAAVGLGLVPTGTADLPCLAPSIRRRLFRSTHFQVVPPRRTRPHPARSRRPPSRFQLDPCRSFLLLIVCEGDQTGSCIRPWCMPPTRPCLGSRAANGTPARPSRIYHVADRGLYPGPANLLRHQHVSPPQRGFLRPSCPRVCVGLVLLLFPYSRRSPHSLLFVFAYLSDVVDFYVRPGLPRSAGPDVGDPPPPTPRSHPRFLPPPTRGLPVGTTVPWCRPPGPPVPHSIGPGLSLGRSCWSPVGRASASIVSVLAPRPYAHRSPSAWGPRPRFLARQPRRWKGARAALCPPRTKSPGAMCPHPPTPSPAQARRRPA